MANIDRDYRERLLNTLDQSPMSTPSKSPCDGSCYIFKSPNPSRENYYDRYIPSRVASSSAKKCLFETPLRATSKKDKDQTIEPPKAEALTQKSALQNELLGESITEVPDPQTMERGGPLTVISPSKSNMLKFQSSPQRLDPHAPYAVFPISKSSKQLLLSPRRVTRKISKTPFKVLDAPELQDDFYLNLLDWSSHNVLSVGLGTAVYLWSAFTCQVSKLCDLQDESDSVTSVSWSDKHLLAVGTQTGLVQIWDVAAEKKLRTMSGHSSRVGALAWNWDTLCSGSRDHTIVQWDHRVPDTPTRTMRSHTQEVCGLRWSTDHQLLASGGNDNKLYVWNQSTPEPALCYTDHTAAVKAIAWSPHQHGILASGGGTADRTIRFWNTSTNQPLQSIDTGSQVCNLVWSKSTNELVSTHGYSQNQIVIWRYPSLTQVAKLTGHTTRVLYLAMSPDGQTIVTGAGDETLRFWNVFYKSRSHKETCSPLNMAVYIR